MKLLIIKLGGSVITHKEGLKPKARISVIRRLSKEIKKIQNLGFKTILVHGAGSFAHGLMKKNNIHKGMKTEKQILDFTQVTMQMSVLNSILVRHLITVGVKAVGIVPHSFILQSGGILNQFKLGLVKSYLRKGLVPIISGNLVLDDKWGCSPLSGDTITAYIGKKLKAHKVIFLSDVDGIYTADPKKNSKAKLIPEVNNSNFNQIIKNLTSTGRADVTGEMRGKLIQIKKLLANIPVIIANGNKTNRLIQVLTADHFGTKLHFVNHHF